jgi:hypothetical protein
MDMPVDSDSFPIERERRTSHALKPIPLSHGFCKNAEGWVVPPYKKPYIISAHWHRKAVMRKAAQPSLLTLGRGRKAKQLRSGVQLVEIKRDRLFGFCIRGVASPSNNWKVRTIASCLP